VVRMHGCNNRGAYVSGATQRGCCGACLVCPLGRRRACVGCWPGPSPALMIGTDATEAAIFALPAWKWRSTMQSE
jgi:hypothetical protein